MKRFYTSLLRPDLLVLCVSCLLVIGCVSKPDPPPDLYDPDVGEALQRGKEEFQEGNVATARTRFMEALKRSIQADDVVGILRSYVNLASVEVQRGDLESAKQFLKDAALARESYSGDTVPKHRRTLLNEAVFEIVWLETYVSVAEADFAAANKAFVRLDALAKTTGERKRLSGIRIQLLRGQSALKQAKVKPALDAAQAALAALDPHDGWRFHGEAYGLLATAQLRQGELTAAGSSYQQALDFYQKARYHVGIGSILDQLAALYVKSGENELAERYQVRSEAFKKTMQ